MNFFRQTKSFFGQSGILPGINISSFTSFHIDRANLPKEVMEFQDMPYSRHLPSFLRHTDVRAYLEKYARQFNLYKYIRFATKVKHVTPCSTDFNESFGNCSWKLTAIEKGGQQFEEVYDSVLVCNG